MPDSPTLFICHTGIDQAYVELLVSRLEREDIRCWYYERDNFGQSIGAAVDQALMSCRALLFVMSKNIPQASDYIQNEIITFVVTKRPVIPLRVQQPDLWWPEGVRSLIGALPVIQDSHGTAPHIVLSEIKRRVFHVPVKLHPVLPCCRRSKRLLLWTSTFAIIACLVFSFLHFFKIIVDLRRPTPPPPTPEQYISGRSDLILEYKDLLRQKEQKIPVFLRPKWNILLTGIDLSENLLDLLDKSIEEEEISSAEKRPIRHATPQYEP